MDCKTMRSRIGRYLLAKRKTGGGRERARVAKRKRQGGFLNSEFGAVAWWGFSGLYG